MEDIWNSNSKDEVHQKLDAEEGGAVVIQGGIKTELDDDETMRMSSVIAEESVEVAVSENGEGVDSSSSSSDEETEVAGTEKTDDTGVTSTVKYEEEEENGVSDLIVEEQPVEIAVEIESSQITEELEVAEVIEEHISLDAEEDFSPPADGEANGFVEEEKESIITEEPQGAEAVAVELSDVVEENGVKESAQFKSVEEDSLLELSKSSNGTDDSNKAELPETNGNPHIISISARTNQPTSWRGCCGLLEVFRRGDRS